MTVDLISRIAEKARAGNSNTASANNSDLIVSLQVNSIKYHPKNHLYFKDLDRTMKDKLMEDMRDNGQINPIIVKKNNDDTYTVLAGHQRLIAARRLNWQQIKAIVIEVSEFEAEKLLIRDNLFRRHMGGMELARALDAYSKLSDNQTRKSIRQIAEEIGENRNTVHFYIKLNNLIGEYHVHDPKLNQYKFFIHDYFFAKALEKVRPGGIIGFITSKGTLDKANNSTRKYLAQRADLIGAIRLPNNAFKANANTEVTTDIIFLQKRDRLIDHDVDWMYTGLTGIPSCR